MSTDNPTDPTVAANRQAQRDLYGDTLAARISALTASYGVSQRRLAQVLGISAPMLSQLISGRRMKMGNTLAYERMVTLGDRAAEAVESSDPHATERILAEVAASDAVSTVQMRAQTSRVRRGTAKELLDSVPPDQLRAARERLATEAVAPDLIELIDRALQR